MQISQGTAKELKTELHIWFVSLDILINFFSELLKLHTIKIKRRGKTVYQETDILSLKFRVPE